MTYAQQVWCLWLGMLGWVLISMPIVLGRSPRNRRVRILYRVVLAFNAFETVAMLVWWPR
jgi:hypothetical protein